MIGLKLIIAILFFAPPPLFFGKSYSLGQSDRKVKSAEGGWGWKHFLEMFLFLDRKGLMQLAPCPFLWQIPVVVWCLGWQQPA